MVVLLYMYMIFVITEIVCVPTGTSSALKKKIGKESQYIVSCPGTSSDPPFGSDRESGCDTSSSVRTSHIATKPSSSGS